MRTEPADDTDTDPPVVLRWRLPNGRSGKTSRLSRREALVQLQEVTARPSRVRFWIEGSDA